MPARGDVVVVVCLAGQAKIVVCAHTSPEESAREIRRDIANWSKMVKAGNIRVN